MGPLLPIGILLGSFWYLDKESEKQASQPKSSAPHFSPLAIGRVTTTEGGVRSYQPGILSDLAPLLQSSSIELLQLEGTPVGAHIFKLIPFTAGAATAMGVIDTALRSGQVVLGSLALILGGPADQQLLLVGGPDVKAFANARSVFAVLAERRAMPVQAEAAPEAEPEPVKKAVPNALRKVKANGQSATPAVVIEEAAPVETSER